jgi:hypothetical protein
MKVSGFLIMHPGGDRPYFSHSYPTDYLRVVNAQVFRFELEVPGFEKVDGMIQATCTREELFHSTATTGTTTTP